MIDVATIGIGVGTAKLKAGSRDLDSFGASADKASRKADGLTGATENLSGSFSALARLLPVLGLATLAANFVRASDEMTKMNAQLRIATSSQKEFNEATRNVQEIAKRAQADIGSIGTVYARLANALKDVGASQKQVSNVTEALALSLKVNGATAAETTSTMLQLSQAFGKGKLDGDEFRTAMEAAPNVMRELAKAMGVPFGALKDLAAQGAITSEVMLKAFNNPELLEALRKQAEQTETVNGAWQNFTNSLTLSLGKINEVTGASKILIGVLDKAATLLSVFRGGEDGSMLRNFLDGGNKAIADKAAAMSTGELKQAALWYSWAREALKARQELSAGMTLGGMSPNGSIAPNFSSTVVAEDINKIHQQQEEALRIKTDAQKKYDAMRKKSNDEALKDIQDSIDEETEMLDAKNSYELKQLKAIEKQKEDDYKQQLKRLDELQDVANANFKAAQDAYKKEQEEARKEFDKTVDSINNIFREGFANLVNGGKGTWKSFTKSLFTTFKTAVANQIYKLLAQPFVISLVAGMSGIGLSGSANAAGSLVSSGGGVTGGIGDLFSSVKNLSSAIQGGLQSSIEGLGSYIANLGGADSVLGSLGGAIGQYSATIANVLPYAGALIQAFSGDIKGAAFTAAGAAIGSIIPGVGTAIGAVIGSFVGSLFGGNSKGNREGAGVGTSYQNGKFGVNEVGKGTATRFNDSYVDPLTQLSKAFANQLGTLLTNFGLTDRIIMGADFKAKEKGGEGQTKGEFGGLVNGKRFFEQFSFDQKDNAAFQKYIDGVLGSTMVKAIQASTLPKEIRNLFSGFVDRKQVLDLMNATISLNGAQKQLAERFGITVNQSAQAAKSTGLAGQALIDYVNKLTGAANAFKTAGDLIIEFRTSLEKSYGGQLPVNLKAFDDALKGIDKSTQSGIDAFNKLFGIRDQFIAFTNSIDGLKGGVKAALFPMLSSGQQQAQLQADLAKAFGELNLAVPGSIQELIAIGQSIDYTTKAGLDLASVFPSLVTAFNQTQEAADALFNTLRDQNAFKTLVDFTRYQRVSDNYGASFANNYVDSLPSYDVGTSYVPSDGPAMLHQGEAVLTRSENAARGSSDSALVQEVRALRFELKATQVAMTVAVQKQAKITDDWDKNGIPATRTE